ncbi:hypothetical protein ABZ876_08275 [Streptomyces sp. NPDC046931]|uniref:hypothetical protein n=1 Tax=Streptomyces sp. NPDC046931 TaxID=3154806 RepID=UPI0033E1BA87
MTIATPRMPVEFSDDLDRALYRETTRQVPDAERATCPLHLDWRSHCRGLHVQRPAA